MQNSPIYYKCSHCFFSGRYDTKANLSSGGAQWDKSWRGTVGRVPLCPVACPAVPRTLFYVSRDDNIVGTMVRNRKTSAKGKIADSVFELAIKEVIDGKLSLRAASESYVIPKSTLARAVTKRRKAGEASVTYQPRWDNRRVFSTEHEVMLESYLVEGAKHHAGLTKVMMRQFAYEYAKKLNLKYPSLWDKNEKAG